jgi:hypothetical protein
MDPETRERNLLLSRGVEIGNPSEPAKDGMTMEAHTWLYADLEKRRIDARLRAVAEVRLRVATAHTFPIRGVFTAFIYRHWNAKTKSWKNSLQ